MAGRSGVMGLEVPSSSELREDSGDADEDFGKFKEGISEYSGDAWSVGFDRSELTLRSGKLPSVGSFTGFIDLESSTSTGVSSLINPDAAVSEGFLAATASSVFSGSLDKKPSALVVLLLSVLSSVSTCELKCNGVSVLSPDKPSADEYVGGSSRGSVAFVSVMGSSKLQFGKMRCRAEE